MKLVSGNRIRKANSHFFEESGIRSNRSTKQHPYLILRKTKTRLNVDLVFNSEDLLELPNNTKVLAQWKGKKRSDFYGFKVVDFKKHLAENPRQPRQKV
jgi:hypothetical protein